MKKLASLAALAALAVAAPAANANHLPSNLGLEVIKVDPATRSVEGIQHCTAPERAGRPATFKVTPDIEFGQFHPGQVTGVALSPDNVILSTGPMPCNFTPQGPPPPPVAGQPGQFAPPPFPGPHGPGPVPGPRPDGPAPHGEHDGPGFGPGAGPGPRFDRAFINRVWKFQVELDTAEGGKLDVTIGKVLNLPKKFRSQDDDLLDEAAVVLLDKKVRIYKGDKRLKAASLEDHDGNLRVHGKLVAPHKWVNDEDGEPVPTIRAKKIYL